MFQPTPKTIAFGIVALAAAGVLGIVAWSVRHAYAHTHPRRLRISPVEESVARAALPGLENVTIRTKDGLALRGWFVPGTRRDSIILVHGLGGNRASLVPEARILVARGHGALLYDSRASGDSEGDLATWGDREPLDVAGALDWLASRKDVETGRIGIYGLSVGATTAARAAGVDSRIHAVLLGPIWPSLAEELADKSRRFGILSGWATQQGFQLFGVVVNGMNVMDAIRAIPPRPLMLISGTEDSDTPPSVMERVHAVVPLAEWWLVPGAGHGNFAAAAPAEYARRFGDFFDESL